ncbi:MAG: hypothetical protein V7711_18950, partial [Pseudomonadales bacterium]
MSGVPVKRIVISLASLVAVFLIGYVLLKPFLVNKLEEAIQDSLNMDTTISSLHIQSVFPLKLSAQNIRLASHPGQGGYQLDLVVGELSLEFYLSQLFDRIVKVDDIVIEDVALKIVESTELPPQEKLSSGDGGVDSQWKFELGHVSIESTDLSFTGVEEFEYRLHLDTLQSDGLLASPMILEGAGAFSGERFSFSINTGSVLQILALEDDIPIKAEFELEQSVARIDGQMDLSRYQLQLAVDVSLVDVGQTASFLEMIMPAGSEVGVTAQLLMQNKILKISDVAMDVTRQGEVQPFQLDQGDLLIDPGKVLALSLSGKYMQWPFNLDLSGDSLKSLLDVKDKSPIKIKLKVVDFGLEMAGYYDAEESRLLVDSKLDFNTGEGSFLSWYLDQPLPDVGSLSLVSSIDYADDRVDVGKLRLTGAAADLAGGLSLQFAEKPVKLGGSVDIKKLDIALMTQSLPDNDGDPMLAPIPMSWLEDVELNLDLRSASVTGIPHLQGLSSLRANLQTTTNSLQLLLPSISIKEQQLKASLAYVHPNQWSATLKSDEISLAHISSALELGAQINGVLDHPELVVRAQGDTLADLLYTVQGQFISPRLALPYKDQPDGLLLTSVNVTSESKGPVRLSTEVSAKEAKLALTLSVLAGTLADIRATKRPWNELSLDAEGSLDTSSFKLTGSAKGLLYGGRVEFDLMGDLANSAVEVKGEFPNISDTSVIDSHVSLKTEDIYSFLNTLGVMLPKDPEALALELSGQLKTTPDTIALSDVALLSKLGDISGSFSIQRGERPLITAKLSAPTLVLAAGDDELLVVEDGKPQSDSKRKKRTRERLIPDIPISIPGLRQADLNINIQSTKFEFGTLKTGDSELDIQLHDGVLDTRLHLLGGRIENRFHVYSNTQGQVNGNVSLQMQELPLDKLMGEARHTTENSSKSAPKVSVDLQLDAQGNSLRELLAAADGHVLVWLGPGWL